MGDDKQKPWVALGVSRSKYYRDKKKGPKIGKKPRAVSVAARRGGASTAASENAPKRKWAGWVPTQKPSKIIAGLQEAIDRTKKMPETNEQSAASEVLMSSRELDAIVVHALLLGEDRPNPDLVYTIPGTILAAAIRLLKHHGYGPRKT